MSVEFAKSETKENLMRAFAGESQARNRYTFAASQAKKNGLAVIEQVFLFTAGQEKEHAEIFWKHLSVLSGQTVDITAGYPVDASDSIVALLRSAQHNEYEEHDPVYKTFAEVAEKEGFATVGAHFRMIADIERLHGNRFGHLAELLEQQKLFVSDVSCKWMCLNCGHVYEGTQAPQVCPVCAHDRGYFIRVELAPYTSPQMIKTS